MNPAISGIYRNMPDAEYRAIDACNQGSLKYISEWSPLHLDYRRKHPEPPTPALRRGSGVDCLLFDGEEAFSGRFAVFGRSKADQDAKRAWLEAGKIPLADGEIELCHDMAEAVKRHEIAAAILATEGDNQLSIVWKDKETGCPCKGRLDMDRPTWNGVADLKSTDCANPESFTDSIQRFRYHWQAAFYLAGMAALGQPRKEWIFVVVESEPPHAVMTYRLDPTAITIGAQELQPFLKLWHQCHETGRWYGYGDGPADITLPAWKIRQSFRTLV